MDRYSFHALRRSKVSAVMTFYRVIAIAMIISCLDSINKIGVHAIRLRRHTMHGRPPTGDSQRAICSRCSILVGCLHRHVRPARNGERRIRREASGAALITLSTNRFDGDNDLARPFVLLFCLYAAHHNSQPQPMTNHFKFRN